MAVAGKTLQLSLEPYTLKPYKTLTLYVTGAGTEGAFGFADLAGREMFDMWGER